MSYKISDEPGVFRASAATVIALLVLVLCAGRTLTPAGAEASTSESANAPILNYAGSVYAVAVNGNDVYVGGEFTSIGNIGARNIAKWNSQTGVWSELGDGLNGGVQAIAVNGTDVYIGGRFTAAINPGGGAVTAYCIAKWNGSSWSALGASGINGNGVNGDVASIAFSGGSVYIGGGFNTARNNAASTVSANGVARWNGTSWSALGSGSGSTGNGVWSAGSYTVYAVAASGSDIYVGGSFTRVNNSSSSNISTNCIAKWNSATGAWSALGAGSGAGGNGFNGDVIAVTVSGADVYAGGAFTSAYNNTGSAVSANHIARWNGSSWSALGAGIGPGGNGVNGTVTTIALSGGSVYAGGDFGAAYNSPGGISVVTITVNCIARWNGTSWSALGRGMNDLVYAVTPIGADLIVGGDFTVARNTGGDVNASSIARWNGTLWSALGANIGGGAISNVSAASFGGAELAAESIVAAFGSDLATATQSATAVPLPTTLGGTTVRVRDSSGAERAAPIFFVSPSQVNYQVPPGTANGVATVTITSTNGRVSTGSAQISPVAPGLFSANANGQGTAAGVVLRLRGNGTQQYEPISQFDSSQNRFVSTPIDIGPNTDQVFLILFGVGARNRSSLSAVAAQIGGAATEALYAGPQGDFVGLDQINLRIPRSLAGRGEVDVVMSIDGKNPNVVRINIR
jgi:uncharacterized protein (TIGR03437 family)